MIAKPIVILLLSLFTYEAIAGWTDDLTCLSKAIYFEARGEPHKGQVAVAHVIVNRTNNPKFPESICKVILQPNQFTFYKKAKVRDRESYNRAEEIASNVLSGQYEDPTNGALYFAHHSAVKGRTVYNKYNRIKIGQHYFWSPKLASK